MLLAILWLPAGASATTFSFGTVNPTDVITSLTFAPSATKTSFDPGTGTLHLEAYLSQINFSNRPNITGIAADTVLLTSDIMLAPASFQVVTVGGLGVNPTQYSVQFANGLVDLGIVDTVGFGGSGPITVLDTDYSGGLNHTARETGPFAIAGELTASLDVLGSSDPDFLSAFKPFAEMDADFTGFFSDGVSVGGNLCNLVKAGGGTHGSQSCGPGFALDDFTTNAGITIIPIPEPGTALLLGLGLAGVAALRRK